MNGIVLVILGVVFVCAVIGYEIWKGPKAPDPTPPPTTLALPGDTIFVCLPVYDEDRAAVRVSRMFESAHDPRRVFVGVLEHNTTAGAVSLVDRYTLQTNGKPSFLANIRYTRGGMDTILGGSVARQLIVDQLYNGEKLVLFVHSHTWFLDGWDRRLVEDLDRAHKKGGHLVSQCPWEKADQSGLLGVSTLPATFPVFKKFNRRGVPVFKGRFFSTYQPDLYEHPVISFKCLFGTAKNVLPFADIGVPFLSSADSDLVATVRAWSKQYKCYGLTQSVVVHLQSEAHSAEDVSAPALKNVARAVVEYFCRGTTNENTERLAVVHRFREEALVSPAEMYNRLGLDPNKGHACGRLSLGLLHATPDQKEILQKFGSRENFEQLKRKYTV
jgi:hypothetical protein